MVLRVPRGNHCPGRLRAEKITRHGVPTVAARCIGPLSCPINKLACFSTAALARGPVWPHRLSRGPGHDFKHRSERAYSSEEPRRTKPTPERRKAICRKHSAQFGSVQSLASILAPRLAAMKGLGISANKRSAL